MSDETTLLSCPFCGGEANTVGDDELYWTVECHDCCAHTGGYAKRGFAIAAWNTRAELGSGTCENASELNTDGLAGYYFTCSECGLSICASMGIGEIELSNPRSFHWKVDGKYEFEKCPRCGKAVTR